MKLKTLTTIVGALALLACNRDNGDISPDNWNNEIRLSSGVTTPTRAYDSDTQIAAGEKINVWVEDKNAMPLYENNILNADGKGGFSYQTTMYYTSPDPVNIYAIHSNPAYTKTAFPSKDIPITHKTETDQTTSAAYTASDLLFAIKKEVSSTPDVIPLTFYHMLSKVEVVLKRGNGNPDLAGVVVTIDNTRTQATFRPDKNADMTQATARAGMVEASGSITPIIIPTMTTTDFNAPNIHYAEAIVVPQTVDVGKAFIRVKLPAPDGRTFIYKIPAGASLKLESGKKYIYNITVDLNDLIVDSTIKDWEAVGQPREGSAFPE
ncbi:fimbrillin family protein [uncultured Odoribacter sp.]|uniref:fimbrillin family protein n=1 Tax=uncultured Odoribacter sp. TaxID=876416 RepID=UPI00263753C4|nr:fimbrillin family protein [uncultured Odoribacter sp.]